MSQYKIQRVQKIPRRVFERELHYQTVVPRVFNRDGWYLDRLTGYCWKEQHESATLSSKDDFLYSLRLLNLPKLNKDVTQSILKIKEHIKIDPIIMEAIYWQRSDLFNRLQYLRGRKRLSEFLTKSR